LGYLLIFHGYSLTFYLRYVVAFPEDLAISYQENFAEHPGNLVLFCLGKLAALHDYLRAISEFVVAFHGYPGVPYLRNLEVFHEYLEISYLRHTAAFHVYLGISYLKNLEIFHGNLAISYLGNFVAFHRYFEISYLRYLEVFSGYLGISY
jgi:hypothetical protein